MDHGQIIPFSICDWCGARGTLEVERAEQAVGGGDCGVGEEDRLVLAYLAFFALSLGKGLLWA